MTHPQKQSFENFGQLVDGEQYVRSIAAAGGKIYAGIGSHAHLVELDPETGEKREIPLPEGCHTCRSRHIYYKRSALGTN
jgi:streptogramin lyase